jgi:EKC/KEOPS complex subunit CGI121/TPRKB
METYEYPQFNVQALIGLFVDVSNAAHIRTRIVNASSMTGEEGELEREAVNFAFVDARLVSLSLFSYLVLLRRALQLPVLLR